MSHILMDGMLILLLGGHVVLCGRHFSNLISFFLFHSILYS